jgi:hypothetical protein
VGSISSIPPPQLMAVVILLGNKIKLLLPTRLQISPTNGLDLDEEIALRDFYGKDLSEAEGMIRNHPEYHTDSLLHMGDIAFNFYFRSFLKYLESEESRDDLTLFTFFTLIENRLEENAKLEKEVIEMSVNYLNYCTNHLYEFSIQPKFRSRLEKRVDKYYHILKKLLGTEYNNTIKQMGESASVE